MKTKFFFLFSTVLLLFAAGCSDDKKSEPGGSDGPAGSSQQFIGSWSLLKMQCTIAGQWVEMSAADTGITFNWTFSSNGSWTAVSNGVDFPGSGTWSYTSGSRNLHLTELGYTYDFFVRSLTDSELAVRLDGIDWELDAAPTLVFGRSSRAVQAASTGSSSDLRTALSEIVNRSLSIKTDR